MGIGIDKFELYEIWDIPLIGNVPADWNDNTWIVQHLRQLANKIESENPKILHIGLKTDYNNHNPILEIKTFRKEN